MTEKETKTNELTPEQKIEDIQKEAATLPAEKKQVKHDAIVKDTLDRVCASIDAKIKNGDFTPREGFDWKNAAVGMGLVLKTAKDKNNKPALEVCTPISIYNVVYEAAVKGLAAVRNQCYPIVYGNELTLQVSYFGYRAQLLSLPQVVDCNALVIYEGDEFSYEIEDARIVNVKHKQNFQSMDASKIVGAYATIVYTLRGQTFKNTTVMNKASLDAAKAKGAANSGAYKDFGDMMARKTIFKRAAKDFLNSVPFDVPRDVVETFATDAETGEPVRIDQSKVINIENPEAPKAAPENTETAKENAGRPW